VEPLRFEWRGLLAARLCERQYVLADQRGPWLFTASNRNSDKQEWIYRGNVGSDRGHHPSGRRDNYVDDDGDCSEQY